MFVYIELCFEFEGWLFNFDFVVVGIFLEGCCGCEFFDFEVYKFFEVLVWEIGCMDVVVDDEFEW